MGCEFTSRSLVMEFIVGDYSLPLVYISTDNPDDVDDTCSHGGRPVDRLGSNWYVLRGITVIGGKAVQLGQGLYERAMGVGG